MGLSGTWYCPKNRCPLGKMLWMEWGTVCSNQARFLDPQVLTSCSPYFRKPIPIFVNPSLFSVPQLTLIIALSLSLSMYIYIYTHSWGNGSKTWDCCSHPNPEATGLCWDGWDGVPFQHAKSASKKSQPWCFLISSFPTVLQYLFERKILLKPYRNGWFRGILILGKETSIWGWFKMDDLGVPSIWGLPSTWITGHPVTL